MMRDDRIWFGKQPGLDRDPRQMIHPGFDCSWIVPVNKRFGFSVATGKSTQYSHQVGHTNTWRGVSAVTNGNAFPHTVPGRPHLSAHQVTDAPKESARESLGLTLDVQRNVSFRDAQRLAVVTGVGIEPDTFNYAPARNTVDVLGEYTFRKRFAMFANLRNVGDVPNEGETVGPTTPAHAKLRCRERYGSLRTFGVKGTF